MEEKTIPINRDQYLQHVYSPIETNTILNKKISGVGATHCEITAPRNSIIVVPNVPIISCKVEKHQRSDNLFGVMQYITPRDIVKYLERTMTKGLFIKIMVTPESFKKVRDAFTELNINIYEECFLMLDECHKFIQESDFREDITLPFNSFFKFKNKALVSATPLIPSDPRFKEQSFQVVTIEPIYDFKHDITIIETDDIRRAFQKEISWIKNGVISKAREPQCYFMNDIPLMIEMILDSNLQEISSVFCSDKAYHKFKDRGIKNVHTEWRKEFEKPLMFFTSRFYTGLDIWLDKLPKVMYFSDATYGDFTLMDPYTDMAQACGRFRRGTIEIDHYVIFNHNIEVKTPGQIKAEIRGEEKAYNTLTKLYNETTDEDERNSILNIIQNFPDKEIFTEDTLDYFKIDKKLDIQRIRGYYTDVRTLKQAYYESGYFHMPSELDPPYIFKNIITPISNEFSSNKKLKSDLKDRQRKLIVDFLEILKPYHKTFEINEIICTYSSYDKLIVDAYFKLGPELIKQCNYNSNKLKVQLSNIKFPNRYDETFYSVLLATFEVGKKYLCSEAKEKLQKIYDKFNLIPPSTITAQSLKWHFEIDHKARIGNPKAIKIIRPTAEGLVKYYNKIKNNKETQPSEEE